MKETRPVIAIFYTVMTKKPWGKRFKSAYETFDKADAERMVERFKAYGWETKVKEQKCY